MVKLGSLFFVCTVLAVAIIVSPLIRPVCAVATVTWSKTYGGAGNERAYAMVKTNDGGYALAGTTNSFSQGLINAWLLKVGSDGTPQWDQVFSGLGVGIVTCMVQTGDGGYALGGYTYSLDKGGVNPWIVKTDSTGNLLWNNTYSQLGFGIIYGLVQNLDLSLTVVGAYNSFGDSGVDSFLARINADGGLRWNRTFAGPGEDELFAILKAGDGGYVLGGYTSSWDSTNGSTNFWLLKTDASGMLVWNHTYSGFGSAVLSTVAQTSDGGYALVGYRRLSGQDDFLLVKTDSSGLMLWNKTYSQSNLDDALCGIQTVDGGYAIAGVTNASGTAMVKVWLIKTDPLGEIQWNQTYNETGQTVPTSLVQASDGGYVLAGYMNSTTENGEDFWLMKTDEFGVVPEYPNALMFTTFLFAVTISCIALHRKFKIKQGYAEK